MLYCTVLQDVEELLERNRELEAALEEAQWELEVAGHTAAGASGGVASFFEEYEELTV